MLVSPSASFAGALRRWLASSFAVPSARVSLAIAGTATLGLCAVPLLGVQGPESALCLGMLLPPMAALVAAQLTSHARQRGDSSSVTQVLDAALGHALSLFVLPCVLLWLDALRVRNCTPLTGLLFMLLGPGFGVLLGSMTGVICGMLVARPRLAGWLAFGLPVGEMLLGASRFYATPAIFAYGHYFGYFAGTLYDEGVAITTAFVSLRVATSAFIAGLALLVVSTGDPSRLRLSFRPRQGRRSAFVVALLCLAGAFTAEIFAPQLGHASSVAMIREGLGGELLSARCHLYFPRELQRRTARRLGEECDFRTWQAEHWLGLTHPGRISVFFFRSHAEKAALMGAAGTNIAKPWRSEAYVSEPGWPNPVLGHELVHVVARGAGRGPLRVAAANGGLWPDPALIEGVAVAAAWQPQGGLTPHQWARAMLDLGMAPRLSALLGAGFLGQERGMAYTLSGSLLRFVDERYGSAAVRRAYQSDDLSRAISVPLNELEQKWHAYLRRVPLPASALALARARFAGSSIFSEVCPHALAKLRESLGSDLAAGDDPAAQRECIQILDVDGSDASTRAILVSVLARIGEQGRAHAELAELEGPRRAPDSIIALARQSLADEAFRRGDLATAKSAYQRLLGRPSEDDTLRLLQVKLLGLEGGARQAQLIFELLVGDNGERADGATAVHLARELRAERSDGLPHYLEARQLYFQRRFGMASDLLAQARARGLPTPELSAEALRLLGISHFAQGELASSAEAFSALAQDGHAGHAAEASDWLQRIAFARRSAASQ